MNPVDAYRKYETQGPLGILLGATDYAMHKLGSVTLLDVVKKGISGDIVTNMDRAVHDSIVEFIKYNNIEAIILGEEGSTQVESPKWAILVDEIEGTQNAVNALPHGINMAIAPYSDRIMFKDFQAAVVTNLLDGRIFVAERGEGAYKIVAGERVELQQKETDVYECPHPRAYMPDAEENWNQKQLLKFFAHHFGNQLRSVDATGTRLVELADGNIRAYGDWRNVTKCWDVLPSGLIVQEAGYKFTDVYGFDLGNAVVYDNWPTYRFRKVKGINIRVGENFIAASPEDHGKVVWGENAPDADPGMNVWSLMFSQGKSWPIGAYSENPKCMMAFYKLESHEQDAVKHYHLIKSKIEALIDIGRKPSIKLRKLFADRFNAYLNGLRDEDKKKAVMHVRQFVDIYSKQDIKRFWAEFLPKDNWPRDIMLHLEAFGHGCCDVLH